MRVLHVVKTSDGGFWAARQAAVLAQMGAEVHVALPRLEGRALEAWRQSGAIVHECDLDMPMRHPFDLFEAKRRARQLVSRVAPDLIHSHFVGTTLLLRLALGKNHSVPRIFQVPGPLHLEHPFYRRVELALAGKADFWIGSSRCIVERYQKAGVSGDRIFLSYYGDRLVTGESPNGTLRRKIGASPDEILIGSISWMYPPKLYLGQRIGLKAHEDLIEALGIVCRRDRRVRGVIAGGAWGGADWYARRLMRQAENAAGQRISFTGALSADEAKGAWNELDLAVHVPISENCGGVIEPLAAGVPVIASRVGGLPEVIFDRITGRLVPPRNPRLLAEAILRFLDSPDAARAAAERGRRLVEQMFDVKRTAPEVFAIYKHVLNGGARAEEYDSASEAARLLVPTVEELLPNVAGINVRNRDIPLEIVSCQH